MTATTWLTQPGSKTANGWQNIVVTLKWKPYVSAEHEFMLSVGVQRESLRAPAPMVRMVRCSTTTTAVRPPNDLLGEGFRRHPGGWILDRCADRRARLQVADTKLKIDPTALTSDQQWHSNGWTGGLSLQLYSIRYLSAQVKDYGLPEFVNKLTPVVELSWSSPRQPTDQGHRRSICGASA